MFFYNAEKYKNEVLQERVEYLTEAVKAYELLLKEWQDIAASTESNYQYLKEELIDTHETLYSAINIIEECSKTRKTKPLKDWYLKYVTGELNSDKISPKDGTIQISDLI